MVKNLRALRTERKLSQEEFGKRVNLSQQTVHKYETGKTEPDIATLILLANFFEVSVDYLIGNTDIRRRYEKTRTFDLNTEEAHLIEVFRRIRPKYRKGLCTVVYGLQDAK